MPEDITTNDRYKGAYLNRFLSSTFTPGSVYKTVTLAAALEESLINRDKKDTFVLELRRQVAEHLLSIEGSHLNGCGVMEGGEGAAAGTDAAARHAGTAVSRADRLTLGKAFVEIGRQYGLTIRPCAEGDELAPYGADCSGCMTQQIFETALHRRLHLPVRFLRQTLAHDCIVKYHGSKNVRDLFHLAWSPFCISKISVNNKKTALVPGDLELSTTPLPFQCSKIYACCGKMSSGSGAISFGGFHRISGEFARFFILDTCKRRGVLYTWIFDWKNSVCR